jgi:hypothetical protein
VPVVVGWEERPVSGYDIDVAERLAALDAGHTSAVAGHSQRDLQECAARYGDLFSGKPFD